MLVMFFVVLVLESIHFFYLLLMSVGDITILVWGPCSYHKLVPFPKVVCLDMNSVK
jgi:hypothetical protein